MPLWFCNFLCFEYLYNSSQLDEKEEHILKNTSNDAQILHFIFNFFNAEIFCLKVRSHQLYSYIG